MRVPLKRNFHREILSQASEAATKTKKIKNIN